MLGCKRSVWVEQQIGQHLFFDAVESDALSNFGKSPPFEGPETLSTKIPEQLALEGLEDKDEEFALEALFVGVLGLLDFEGVLQKAKELLDQSPLEPVAPERLCLCAQVGAVDDADFFAAPQPEKEKDHLLFSAHIVGLYPQGERRRLLFFLRMLLDMGRFLRQELFFDEVGEFPFEIPALDQVGLFGHTDGGQGQSLPQRRTGVEQRRAVEAAVGAHKEVGGQQPLAGCQLRDEPVEFFQQAASGLPAVRALRGQFQVGGVKSVGDGHPAERHPEAVHRLAHLPAEILGEMLPDRLVRQPLLENAVVKHDGHLRPRPCGSALAPQFHQPRPQRMEQGMVHEQAYLLVNQTFADLRPVVALQAVGLQYLPHRVKAEQFAHQQQVQRFFSLDRSSPPNSDSERVDSPSKHGGD